MNYREQFVVAVRKPNAAIRLFCFPHAGGGPAMFHGWADRLGPEIECASAQYPGRAHRYRERPLSSIAEIVTEVSEGLDMECALPFAFYGHSLGAVVALELARRLRRQGLPGPVHLFVGAARPPQIKSTLPPIHQQSDDKFIESVQARYGGIPDMILRDSEALRMFLPALRADFAAYETFQYTPEPPLNVPISAFCGAEDTVVTPESMNGWAAHTETKFDLNVLAGGHFFPEAGATALLRLLRARMCADLETQNANTVG